MNEYIIDNAATKNSLVISYDCEVYTSSFHKSCNIFSDNYYTLISSVFFDPAWYSAIVVTCPNCNTTIRYTKISDFPKKNHKCSCGTHWFVKYGKECEDCDSCNLRFKCWST